MIDLATTRIEAFQVERPNFNGYSPLFILRLRGVNSDQLQEAVETVYSATGFNLQTMREAYPLRQWSYCCWCSVVRCCEVSADRRPALLCMWPHKVRCRNVRWQCNPRWNGDVYGPGAYNPLYSVSAISCRMSRFACACLPMILFCLLPIMKGYHYGVRGWLLVAT